MVDDNNSVPTPLPVTLERGVCGRMASAQCTGGVWRRRGRAGPGRVRSHRTTSPPSALPTTPPSPNAYPLGLTSDLFA
ncbi:unnamed protein product, partial [Brenthis ino]